MWTILARRQRLLCLVLPALYLFGLSPLTGQAILIRPYLQQALPDEITVRWETDTQTESTVEYGLTQSLGLTASGTSLATTAGTQLHTTRLTGLTPDTRYYYRARTGGWQSDIHDFRTPPSRDAEAPFNIVLMSDMQKDGSNPTIFSQLVNNSLLPYVADQYGSPLTDHLHMAMVPGDLVDNGNTYLQWKNDFFQPAEALWRHVPVYPAIGNHELNSPNYFNYFTLPTNGTPGYPEHWYAHDYSNVRVLAFNTNGGYRIQAQLDWLDSVLVASCTDTLIDFVFAQMHHPHLSELWTPGNTDYTGDILERLEVFSTQCGKPSVHFFGHTHAYSRGQSRDHDHLWVNVATAGGNIDYWGEFANQDYDEYIISTDDYGFVIVEVTAGPDPAFVMKRLSFGDQYNPGGSVLTDSITIRPGNAPPGQPYPLYPVAGDTVSSLCVTFRGDQFSDPEGDGFGAAHWQLAADSSGFDAPIRESWKQYANWYGEEDLQAGDDLTDETWTGLPSGASLWWRVRYRDRGLAWSPWSVPNRFHTWPVDTLTGNLVENPGAESGTAPWTVTTGFLESLSAGQCSGIAPHTGDKYFAVGALCQEAAFASAYQDMSVAAYAAPIDSGGIQVLCSAYMANYLNTDEPSFALQFLDVGGSVIGSTDTIRHQLAAWTRKELTSLLPPGTRTIRMIIMGTRTAGVDNDSYVDDLFLQLIAGESGCAAYAPPGPMHHRVYVDHMAPAAPDGESWTTAFRSLQDAMVYVGADTLVREIWIADGTYPVDTGSDRSSAYVFLRGMSVYGGFSGIETLLSERDTDLYPAILTGEIGDTALLTDNAWHVVVVNGIQDTLLLDGLMIRDGFADGPGHQQGGGMLIRPTNAAPVILSNCRLVNNFGLQVSSIYNQHRLLLLDTQTDQAVYPGMSGVMVRNEGEEATITISGGSYLQQGNTTPEGWENLGGASLHILDSVQFLRGE